MGQEPAVLRGLAKSAGSDLAFCFSLVLLQPFSSTPNWTFFPFLRACHQDQEGERGDLSYSEKLNSRKLMHTFTSLVSIT